MLLVFLFIYLFVLLAVENVLKILFLRDSDVDKKYMSGKPVPEIKKKIYL